MTVTHNRIERDSAENLGLLLLPGNLVEMSGLGDVMD